jgi:ubiquinone/menaquinone biosynthesis C-methylase UbiE
MGASVTADHYLAGIVGLGLLRTWYLDADANLERMAELAETLARRDEFPYSLVLDPAERDLHAGYDEWSGIYDGPNPMIETEERVAHPILRELARPGMTALDAACGTGRQAALLHELGCSTVGLDQSEPMLAIARSKLPEVRFEVGDVEHLPFDDDQFDLAVVSLALCHLAHPDDAVDELARVLRPGGVLVITDPHPFGAILGGQAFYGGMSPSRPMTWVRNNPHDASTWLRSFRSAGLMVEDCIEEPFSDAQISSSPADLVFPGAAKAAMTGLASVWVWVLRAP